MTVFSLCEPQYNLKLLRELFHAGSGQNLSIESKGNFGDTITTLQLITDLPDILKHIHHTFICVCAYDVRDELLCFPGVEASFYQMKGPAEIVILTASLWVWRQLLVHGSDHPEARQILNRIHGLFETMGYAKLFSSYRKEKVDKSSYRLELIK